MKKIKLKLFVVVSLILAISFFFAILPKHRELFAHAETNSKKTAERIHCAATLEDDFTEDSVIVVLNSEISEVNKIHHKGFFKGIDVDSIKDLTWREINKTVDEDFRQILQIFLKDGTKEKVLQSIAILEQIEGVYSAEPNYLAEVESTPNDPYFADGSLWGLNGTNGINAPSAWNITKGSRKVRVGVIDTGIAYHPDLNVNITKGWDTFHDNNITNDDTHSHGTHVAGTIGAVGNNEVGVVGVNWDVTLVPLQAANENNMFEYSQVEKAIIWAQDRWGTSEQIDIINYSVAGFGEDVAIREAVRGYSGLFVWSAGNKSLDKDKNIGRYGSFDLPNLISVGASDYWGERCSFSNYGLESVNIYAPGSNILSISPENLCNKICHQADSALSKDELNYKRNHFSDGYHYKSGTSMAAPHVTGVAALLLSVNSAIPAARLKNIILDTADVIKIKTADGKEQTVKKLNAYKAVNYANQPVNLMFNGGDGTVNAPFEINNETQLRNVGLAYRSVYVPQQGSENQINYYFKLTNDITLSGDWTPFKYKITGNFNGNGHFITYHMDISQADVATTYLGLFGFVTGSGRIENLVLKDCSIKSDVNTCLTGNSNRIGILAGSIYSAGGLYNVQVVNPTIECNIEDASIGGIAGTIFTTTVSECAVKGGSITSYNGAVGGMAGQGDLGYFQSGVCSTTVTKNNYAEGDLIGEVVGNSSSKGGITGTTTVNRNGSCVTTGTLITLADGTQVPVETLTGDELLLVWNMHTGQYDVSPILFIDRDSIQRYSIINLSFSNGETVKVVSEHGFWNYNLNRYVYLDKDAAKYIGHWFCSQTMDENGNMVTGRVQLMDVTIQTEMVEVYSPVTYGHLCYYVNGMLSMPGGIDGLFNIFAVDAETMSYDQTLMQADIEQYGLFTYEEFAELLPVSEEVFEAFNGQYLKVAMGKGLISWDTLNRLVARYSVFFSAD